MKLMRPTVWSAVICFIAGFLLCWASLPFTPKWQTKSEVITYNGMLLTVATNETMLFTEFEPEEFDNSRRATDSLEEKMLIIRGRSLDLIHIPEQKQIELQQGRSRDLIDTREQPLIDLKLHHQ